MKIKQMFVLVMAVLAAGELTVVYAQSTTSRVWLATISLSGIRDNVSPPPYSKNISYSNKNLVNLAQGWEPNAPITTNQVIALITPESGPNTRIVVFDTQTKNVVAEIGTFVGGRITLNPTTFQLAEAVAVEELGNASFGISEGALMLVGKRYHRRDGTFLKVTLAVTGWLRVTTTYTGITQQNFVIITKGSFNATNKLLATIVE